MSRPSKGTMESVEAFWAMVHKKEWAVRPDTIYRPKEPSYGKRQLSREELLKLRICPETKVCRECKMELPSDAFNKAPSNKDGLQTICRECAKKQNLLRR
jgi:hypothetical protein